MQLTTAYKERLAKAARLASAAALVVTSVGTSVAPTANGAQFVDNKTTITDSRPGQSSVTYSISFKPASSTTAIAKVQAEACVEAGAFGGTCTAPIGLNFDDFTNATITGLDSGTVNSYNNPGSNPNKVEYVVGTPAAHAGATITMGIVNGVTNPTNAGTYYVRVQTLDATDTQIDAGTSAFAIVQSVQVSGRVNEQMTFTVAGESSGVACGTYSNSNIATSATGVPFGAFTTGTPKTGCQKVKTATNAVQGFSTTVQQYVAGNHPAGAMCRQTASDCDGNGATIAGIAAGNVISNAGLTATPAAWTPSTTFGLGVGANGAESTGFNADEFRGFYTAGNAQALVTVATKAAPSAGVDTYVVFKADVPATQTAGVYQNRLMYVSTPTF